MQEQNNSTNETGLWGERQAERFLRQQGCKILGRRVRIGDRDEIDLVARDGDALVFIEVKTRKNESYGSPISVVDRRKKHALSRAAVRYLKAIKSPNVFFRFDVVEVIGSIDDGDPKVRRVRDAFHLDSIYDVP